MTSSRTKSGGLSAQNRRRAKQFLWHLSLPWREFFSHVHWWNESKWQRAKPTHDEVLWEIFRRHPKAAQIRMKSDAALVAESSEFEDSSENLTGIGWLITEHGDCAWPDLSSEQQYEWLLACAEVKPQRGIHLHSVVVLNDFTNGLKLVRSFKRAGVDVTQMEETMRKGHSESVASYAKKADESGKILLAVDPFGFELGSTVEAIANYWRKGRRIKARGNARADQWLTVISAFETAEIERGPATKRDDQLFAQYRRIIGSWSLPSLMDSRQR